MTPVQDYDSSSLKRRNPRQMYTDSSFYSPKFHPSVAEQVEMAHRLSSSLYEDGNKMSKGQEMYMKRAKKSGDPADPLDFPGMGVGDGPMPSHDKVPNLKLVMNPDGKLHDWTDLPEDEVPEMAQVAAGTGNPEAAHAMVENLQACKGRGGELFAKRRKKADKWVVDEQNVGSTTSQFASQLVTSETHETSLIGGGYHRAGEEVDAAEQFRQEQQETFQQQQLAKQQQGLAMRQERSTMNGDQQSLELPPNFKPCSLKGRPFTPTFDLSCHNTQGIDVWKNKGPKPFALGASSTLPRNLGQARAGGQLPPNAAVVQSETSSKKVVSQEVTSSSVSSSHEQQVSSTTTTTSQQQQQHQVIQQNSSSVTAEAASSQQQCATKTQDEVDRAAVEAQMMREQQELEKLKLEEEHRQMEQKRIEEERIRMEQEQRERQLAEQKLREEEQRQREMEEQRRREEEERARREQQEREERERAERERQMREQQEREEQERQTREQQERERQMREQQEREEQERRAREQQERERQMREQQERERQEQMMREQQMREQQMKQQQMMQQTQTVQSQSTMSSTSTSFQQQTSSTLHKSELSMQMKSD